MKASPASTEGNSSSNPKTDNLSYLLQLHIAEYNALTMRNTYWITLQYALWPILLIFLGFVAQARPSIPLEYIIWGSAIVIQIIMLSYYAAQYEQYNNVWYIEHELRPAINSLILLNSFWGYEPYVNSHRGLNPLWWESLPAVLALVTICITCFYRFPWSIGDFAFLFICLLLFYLVARLALAGINRRKDFFTSGQGDR
jgi:hypothetical protein